MDEQLVALYHRHVATAFDRQQRLADFLARHAPGAKPVYDLPTAALAFGKLRFEAPILGSPAAHNQSWLWAWSNKHLKLSITNRALGDTVRMLVHRLSVHGLAAAAFALEPMIGSELLPHAPALIGIVLGRELEYHAYFTIPHEGGRATLLIRDRRLDFKERKPLRRILSLFPEVIRKFPVFDHRLALASYAADYGVSVVDGPTGLRLSHGKDELTATFDDDGRLSGLTGTVAPEPRPAAKKAAPARKKTVKKAASSSARRGKKKPARKPAR